MAKSSKGKGGVSSISLTLLGQSVTLQYSASNAVWYVIEVNDGSLGF